MKKVILTLTLFLASITVCKAQTDTKYYKVVENLDDNTSVTTQITEDEFNYQKENEVSEISENYNTAYKSISITNNNNYIILKVNWLKTPKVTSYDVIALRGEGILFDNTSLSGRQSYVLNNNKNYITYSSSSNNTKILDNGIGISMNLVDGATSYTLSLTISYQKKTSIAYAYGAYQHAQSNVTLSKSQDYTLSSSGYGGVINFSSSVKSYYDGMNGVSISL